MENDQEKNNQQQVPQNPSVDPTLIHIVSSANIHEANVRVILHCGGFIIAGTVISGMEYFTTMIENNSGTEFSKTIEAYRDKTYNVETLKAEFDAGKDPVFLHLKNAVLRSGSIGGGITVPIWRTKIAEINGFTIGSFDPPSPSEE